MDPFCWMFVSFDIIVRVRIWQQEGQFLARKIALFWCTRQSLLRRDSCSRRLPADYVIYAKHLLRGNGQFTLCEKNVTR
jgi:hypothetical protein